MQTFDCMRAQVLWNRHQPDDMAGSDNGIGKAYLYAFVNTPGGHVLHEDKDGFVTMKTYNSDPDLQAAWKVMTDDLEPSGEPEEEDIVIEGTPRGYTCRGEDFPDLDAALRKVREWMDQEQFWPTVWYLSDHGNFHVVDLIAPAE